MSADASAPRGPVEAAGPKTVVEIMSFGFKYGVPEGNVVVDVRFVPNPYYIDALRPLTGKDPACAAYVLAHEGAIDTIEALRSLVEAMTPSWADGGRGTLSIRIGCTGGQHRSVAIAEALGRALSRRDFECSVRHREMEEGRYGPA